MKWALQGTFFSLLMILIVFFDILRNKENHTLLREHCFLRLLFLYILLMVLEGASLSSYFFESTAARHIRDATEPLQPLFHPLMLYMWLCYTIKNLSLKEKTQSRLCFVFVLPLLMSLLMEFSKRMNFPLPAYFITLSPLVIQASLCMFYAGGSFLYAVLGSSIAIYRGSRFLVPIALSMFLFSFLLLLGGSPVFLSLSAACAIVVNYSMLQSGKINYNVQLGLPNRKAFLNDLARLFKGEGQKGTILLADVENFKFFNQRFTEKIGDKLLQQLADYYASTLFHHKVYHLYGDQFAILLTNLSIDQVQHVIDTILERFTYPWVLESTPVLLNLRIASVGFPNQVSTAEEAVNAMDFTISNAKKTATHALVRYDQTLLEKKQRISEVTQALTKAIEEKTLEVYYQPIFTCKQGTFPTAEALVRITDPNMGKLMPSEFIPIAEQTGLIVELTHQVLSSACRFLSLHVSESNKLNRISINLSAIHFMHPHMTDNIMSILDFFEVTPQQIDFEITESSVIQSFDRVKCYMEELTNLGFTFSLDDYGTGYSNVEYLMNLPFTTVKLDKRIISNYQKHPALLESLVFMLHRIGKEIVAEGVENEEQYEILRLMGVDRIQGFYFSKPLREKVYVSFLSQNEEKQNRSTAL
ncbi:MAG: bifunctional diguanylate cyclase/phosphodiesterase [Sphaerochaeta sp.]|nr:bifunctional diguanylate cyclase/phosphodiesterase [Sphaerochaeta sp.]